MSMCWKFKLNLSIRSFVICSYTLRILKYCGFKDPYENFGKPGDSLPHSKVFQFTVVNMPLGKWPTNITEPLERAFGINVHPYVNVKSNNILKTITVIITWFLITSFVFTHPYRVKRFVFNIVELNLQI